MKYRRVNPDSVIFDNEVSNNGMPKDTALGYLTNEQVTGLGEAQRKVADSLTTRDEQDFNYAHAISALLRGYDVNNRQIASNENIAAAGNATQKEVNKYSANSSSKTAEQNRMAQLSMNKENNESAERRTRDEIASRREIAGWEKDLEEAKINAMIDNDMKEDERERQKIRAASFKAVYSDVMKGGKATLSPQETVSFISAQGKLYNLDGYDQVDSINMNPSSLIALSSITYPRTGFLYATLKLDKSIPYKLASGKKHTLDSVPVAVPKVEDWKKMSEDKKLETNRIVLDGIRYFVDKSASSKIDEEGKKAVVLSIFKAYDSYLNGDKKHAIYLNKDAEETRSVFTILDEMQKATNSDETEE